MARFSLKNQSYIHAKCGTRFWEETEHILTSLQITGCVVKGNIRNEIQENITFFSTHRSKKKENDLTYLWNSCSPCSQPYRYKYSYLLRQYTLHCFRKDQTHSRRYLEERNKQQKICNLYSNFSVYIQNTGFCVRKELKRASNFVLESLNLFFERSHSGTIIVTIIDI